MSVSSHIVDLKLLKPKRPAVLRLIPAEEGLANLAHDVGAESLNRITLEGEARAQGRHEWVIEAKLTGEASQACVVTGAPVLTPFDIQIKRRYRDNLPAPQPGESEMPEDIDIEPLPETLDLFAVMAEEIALALPDYPRAVGVEPASHSASPEGAHDEDERENPFMVLQSLKEKLKKN